jgi:Methyltransferase domain
MGLSHGGVGEARGKLNSQSQVSPFQVAMRGRRSIAAAAALLASPGFSTRRVSGFTIPGGRVPGFRLPILAANPFDMKSMVEKVLEKAQWPAEWPYSDEDFKRMDESDDGLFYEAPRLVYHIDDYAVKALTEYYAQEFADGEDVLDICSSWVSHYPKDWKGGKVVGLGMNEYELSKNDQLTYFVVRDLNSDPSLPFDDASFDKVTCVVSVDYLNKPLQVFKEIGRVLRPGGECILSMSNRCFPTKAFQIWLQTSDLEHVFIAGSFFHFSGMFEKPVGKDISPNPGRSDPMFIVKAKRKLNET